MKRTTIVLILTSIRLQNQIPLLVSSGSEAGSCHTQQRSDGAHQTIRESALAAVALQCGSSNWTRVAYLNMGDHMQSCPRAWRDRSANGVRVCGRPAGSKNKCHSTFYSTSTQLYTRVCGQVIGYQLVHTDAFHSSSTVDQPYVEGVSITHGSPRSHIWTLAADLRESGSGCPCKGGESPPSFVGANYYCESGYNGTVRPPSVLYTSDPLWDGAGCESEGNCCSTAPWFTVDLVNPTNDDIEVRICADSGDGEDTPIHLLEIYIQ